AASSQLASLGWGPPTRRHIVWTDRARLQDRQPTLSTREATEDNGVLFGIEVCIEVVAGLGWRERSRHRQAPLGIEGHDHGGIIPPGPPHVNGRPQSFRPTQNNYFVL